MSKPYDCGHPVGSDEHDDYCGVGACYVCMMREERDGLPPHGVVMEAERTLTVTIKDHPEYGPLMRFRVCGDCGMREALGKSEENGLVEEFA